MANAYTEWGALEGVLVGRADGSCFPFQQPAARFEINDHHVARSMPWPRGGRKFQHVIDAANVQLANLADVLAGESVHVWDEEDAHHAKLDAHLARWASAVHPTTAQRDTRVVRKRGAEVVRPDKAKFDIPYSTPFFSAVNGYGHVCPRDSLTTIGRNVIEATMSRRDRMFELDTLRPSVRRVWKRDPYHTRWLSAPRVTMADSMYEMNYWDVPTEERYDRMHHYEHVVNESEIVFDAADITRVGKDIFMQKSMTANYQAAQWLASVLGEEFRVHSCHFPYDLHPSHIDATFVPLRPPTPGSEGIVIVCSERPPLVSEAAMWLANDWKLIVAPDPGIAERPMFSNSSKWISMNILSVNSSLAVIEENEVPLRDLLADYGIDSIGVPFRNVYEFGGSIHCATWDYRRDDALVDYFPDQSVATDLPKDWSDGRPNLAALGTETLSVNKSSGRAPEAATSIGDIYHRTWKDAPAKAGYYNVEGGHGDKWTSTRALVTEDTLRINDLPVMESWEKPYMRELGNRASERGGRVLEIGFGLALSATRVQENPQVTEHVIIEANADVYEKLVAWAKTENDTCGRPHVTPMLGLWKDVIPGLVKSGEVFDGILYDPYPQNVVEQHVHQFLFIRQAWPLLKTGGRLVYCNLTSLGVLRSQYASWEDVWNETQLPYITDRLSGLSTNEGLRWDVFHFDEAMIRQRKQCEYYSHDSALVPVLSKS